MWPMARACALRPSWCRSATVVDTTSPRAGGRPRPRHSPHLSPTPPSAAPPYLTLAWSPFSQTAGAVAHPTACSPPPALLPPGCGRCAPFFVCSTTYFVGLPRRPFFLFFASPPLASPHPLLVFPTAPPPPARAPAGAACGRARTQGRAAAAATAECSTRVAGEGGRGWAGSASAKPLRGAAGTPPVWGHWEVREGGDCGEGRRRGLAW